jgi:2-amino-4-hydroxy-6-hydroxymethyldihydropteridine diphosphokinase
MIYLAFGSNLKSKFGNSVLTIQKSYSELEKHGIEIVKKSSFYKSKAYPNFKDPEFINSVALVKTKASPRKLLNIILAVEKKFGRKRMIKNDPRTLDIDIIDYSSRCINTSYQNMELNLPHPNIESRLFVLGPLYEINSKWKNPSSGKQIDKLIAKIGNFGDNKITKL